MELISKLFNWLFGESVVEDLPTTEEPFIFSTDYNNPYKEEYDKLWSEMIITKDLSYYLQRIFKNLELYKDASRECESSLHTIPWQVIAVIHLMEAGGNTKRQILNGEYWNRRTIYVPKGHGPWDSFEESCVTAFRLNNKVPPIWSVANTLYFLESHNGFGYRKYHKTNSPYLWSFSNHYVKGKYVADGRYDANVISKQPGVAVLLKALEFEEPKRDTRRPIQSNVVVEDGKNSSREIS